MTGDRERWEPICEAVAALNRASGSTTRTHIQKLCYFSNRWGIRPLPHRFVLHHHGPYSFDLDRDLLRMEAFGILDVRPDAKGYGARYSVADVRASDDIDALAAWLGPKTTRDLEALATCEFFAEQEKDEEAIVRRVREVKPHLGEDEVREALREVEERRRELAR